MFSLLIFGKKFINEVPGFIKSTFLIEKNLRYICINTPLNESFFKKLKIINLSFFFLFL